VELWMDAVQNKYMLDQVNDLQKISAQINGHLAKKHYLHATKSLVTALNISEGQLKGVKGLADLRNDFSNKRQMLYTRLIEELNKHLYQTSTQELLSFQRQNSTTKGSAYTSPFQRTTVLRKSAERIEANSKNQIFSFPQISPKNNTVHSSLNIGSKFRKNTQILEI
jgi:exocyst complex component 4